MRKQFMEFGVRMRVDSDQNIFEIFIGINPVRLAGADQRIKDGDGLSTAFVAQKHVVLFSQLKKI